MGQAIPAGVPNGSKEGCWRKQLERIADQLGPGYFSRCAQAAQWTIAETVKRQQHKEQPAH